MIVCPDIFFTLFYRKKKKAEQADILCVRMLRLLSLSHRSALFRDHHIRVKFFQQISSFFVNPLVGNDPVGMGQGAKLIQIIGIEFGGIRQQVNPFRHGKNRTFKTGLRRIAS